MKYRILIFIAVVAIVLPIIFNIDRGNSKILKIGVIVPLTEEAASLGEKVRNGIELAKLQYKDQLVEFIYEDGGVDPKKAVTAFKKLKSVDRVSLFIGPFGPDQILAIAPMLEPQDILLGVSLCEDRFKKYPQIFCTYPSIPDQTASGIEAIKKTSVTKLGFITQSGELGNLIESELKKGQGAGNYSLVITERMKQGDTDFRTLVAKVKSVGVDGIYTASLPDEGYLLVKQIRELQFLGPLFSVFDATEEKLAELGSASEGLYLPGHISPKFEPDFTTSYKEKYSDEPDMYGALGHSIGITLLNALKENRTSVSELKEKLISRTLNTAIINFSFKADQTVSIPVESFVFRGGKMLEMK